MMKHKKFACFILTHGRPDNQKTLHTLRAFGYTGKIYLIVDNEDASLDEYKAKYKDVIVFDKEKAAQETDKGDIIQKKNVVVFARNMCHKIASELGLDYFCELDDDYNVFRYRYIEGATLKDMKIESIEPIFDCYLDFLDKSKALAVCFAQTGDLIGGARDFPRIQCIRKAMNVFFCRTNRPFKFMGRINEDVNAYVTLGHKGNLFFTLGDISVNQEVTQKSDGGLTDSYLENGTYMKSFYTVMMCPSAVKIARMGVTHPRIHHKIDWKKCAPKILRQEWKRV